MLREDVVMDPPVLYYQEDRDTVQWVNMTQEPVTAGEEIVAQGVEGVFS